MESGNLFDELPATSAVDEAMTTLLATPVFRLVRIVSTGQITPNGEWYDQDEAEWVMVVTGRADLLIEGEEAARRVEAGDHVLIPPHVRHRLEWTDPDKPTVWLALHFVAPP